MVQKLCVASIPRTDLFKFKCTLELNLRDTLGSKFEPQRAFLPRWDTSFLGKIAGQQLIKRLFPQETHSAHIMSFLKKRSGFPAKHQFPPCQAVIETASPLTPCELRDGIDNGHAGLLRYGTFVKFVEGLSHVESGPDQVMDGITQVTRRFRLHRAKHMREENERLIEPKSSRAIRRETCRASAYFEKQLILAILQSHLPKVLSLYDELVARGVRIYPSGLRHGVEVYRKAVRNGGVSPLQIHFELLAEERGESFRKEFAFKLTAAATCDPTKFLKKEKILKKAERRKALEKQAICASLMRGQASHLLGVLKQLRALGLAKEDEPSVLEYPTNPPSCVIDGNADGNEDEIVERYIRENERSVIRFRAEPISHNDEAFGNEDIVYSSSEHDPDEPGEHEEVEATIQHAMGLSNSILPLDDDIHGENASRCSAFGQVGSTGTRLFFFCTISLLFLCAAILALWHTLSTLFVSD